MTISAGEFEVALALHPELRPKLEARLADDLRKLFADMPEVDCAKMASRMADEIIADNDLQGIHDLVGGAAWAR